MNNNSSTDIVKWVEIDNDPFEDIPSLGDILESIITSNEIPILDDLELKQEHIINQQNIINHHNSERIIENDLEDQYLKNFLKVKPSE